MKSFKRAGTEGIARRPSKRRGGKLCPPGQCAALEHNHKLPENIMITDSHRIDVIKAAKNLPPGSGIILRDYELGYAERLNLGLQLKKICRQKKQPLIVAKDEKLALALNADGMHFPEFMLAEARRIKFKHPEWLVTIAVHSKTKINVIYSSKLDAVLISPIYKTASHPQKNPLVCIRPSLFIKNNLPAYALGGVDISYKKLIKSKGFHGVAGISWVSVCG